MAPSEIPEIVSITIGEVKALTGRQFTRLAAVVARMVAGVREFFYGNEMKDLGVGVNRA